jgi:pimeloyl-ACP methyl ester carboxylesterase
VKVTFPAEYGAPELAGKDAVFKCTVKEVLEFVDKPVDDELAKKNNFENLEAMRKAVGERIGQDYTQISRGMIKRQLLDKAGLDGSDLVGASVGGAFAAEMAAIFPERVGRLALIAPFGLFDDKEPAADPWAQRKDVLPGLMCAEAATWNELVAPPEGANSVEWPIEMTRASEAAARAFWPLGNTRLEKRLGLIEAPTLILWGDRDAILPPVYAGTFARAIKGAARVEIIANAGHLAYLDRPEALANAVLKHFA